MAQACATLDEVLAVAPAIASFGTQSTGTLTINSAATGGALTITDATGALPIVETYTSGVDWTPGGTTAETTAAIAAALAASAIIDFLGDTNTISVASKNTGALSLIDVSSSSGTMTWDVSTLEGGDAGLNQILACACQMINLACWGVKADCGHTYLTAHLVSTAMGLDNGQVTGKTIDKISVSYSATSFDSSDAAYAATHWGRMYLAERETILVMPVVGTGTVSRVWPRRFFGRNRW